MSSDKSNDLINEVDLRLNGVLGELGRALSEALSKLEDGGGEVRRAQTFQATKGTIRAEAGIRVKVGGFDVSKPSSEQSGATTCTPATSSAKPSVFEINATVVRDDTTWSLTAELPGVAQSDLNLQISDGVLLISAAGARRHYEGQFSVPAQLREDKLSVSLNNGILDLTAELSGGDEI